jgi:hypothetical protein
MNTSETCVVDLCSSVGVNVAVAGAGSAVRIKPTPSPGRWTVNAGAQPCACFGSPAAMGSGQRSRTSVQATSTACTWLGYYLNFGTTFSVSSRIELMIRS